VNEDFKEMKATKKDRMKAIQKVIEKHEVQNQHELIVKLKKDHGIEANQPAISRDIKDLRIIKDSKSGFYTLSPKAQQKKYLNQLYNWAVRAELRSFDTSFEGLLLRTAPEHADMAPVIASSLEKAFSSEKSPVAAFVNSTGMIWLLIPVEKKDSILSKLNKIINPK
jgi:arginine repressor